MATAEMTARDAEQRLRTQESETKRLYAEAVKLRDKVEAEGLALDSPEYVQAEAALDAWEAAGEREMEMKADANRARKLAGFRDLQEGRMIHGSDAAEGERRADPTRANTLGQMFAKSDEFTGWFKRVAANGQLPSNARVESSPPVDVPRLLDMLFPHAATPLTGDSATSAGAFTRAQDTGLFVELGRRPLSILDIIARGSTGSDAVDFVRQTSRSNAAAPVAEASDVSGVSGAKPQSTFAFELVTHNVRTIAHWIAASRRALSDVGQLRTIIDNELRAGLLEEVEDQIINGAGTGQDFEGLDAVSGTQDQSWATNILTTTRQAKRKIRTVGRDIPSAFVLNPEDWETIDLLQDNEARYFFGGPMEMGTPRLWGLPVVESEVLTVGWGWCGNWKRATLWDREQANILVSDSHMDFFTRNLIAILAELRAAFAVTKPVAFIEIDLTS